MVRLNKNHLTDKQFDLLFHQLEKLIDPKQTQKGGAVIRELLGHEERIMVSKRLATIILLNEGYSLYKISSVLKISPATAKIIKDAFDSGAYLTILTKLNYSKLDYTAILKTIDSILHLGGLMPHRNGLERYRGLGG